MARRATSTNSQPRDVIDRAQIEVAKQSLEQLQTVASMQTQLTSQTKDAIKMLGLIHTQLDSMSGGVGGGAAAAAVGSVAGPSFGIGPNGGRPVMPQNQTGRPMLGPGGYPGGSGYGMGGASFGGYGAGAMGGMGGIFGLAQAGVARFVHNRAGFGASPAGAAPAVHYEQQPDGSFTSFDSANKPVEHQISQETYAHRMAVSNSAARIGGSTSMLGSIRGAVSELPLAGKLAGGALIGAEAVHKFGNFVGDQRSANAQYQAIYGPGTSGFDERLHNIGGRFRNMMSNVGSAFGIGSGGLSDSDYDKTFKGVSAMGIGGTDRNNAIKFATNNFNSTGMSPDQSLQLISINAKEAASSFDVLQNKLKQVSEQAQQTSQSAEVFRQSFIQNYGTAVGAGFAGSSATVAGAQVASTVGQGRLFAGLNTSSMFGSVGASQVLANREGYNSVLDFTLAGQSNPMVVAQAQQKQLNQVFESVVSPQVRAAVQAAIAKHGGAQNVGTNQNAAQSVVNDVEQANPGSLNSIAIIQAMRTAGISGAENLDSVAAAIYYVQWVAKNGQNFTNPTAKSIAANQQQQGTVKANLGQVANNLLASPGSISGGQANIAYGNIGGMTVKNPLTGGNITTGGTATYDPVIAKMKSDGVTMVQVQTKDGQQLITLDNAAKDYRDQLVNGTAIIASGPNKGQTVGTIYGKEQNEKYKDTSGTAAKDGVFSKSVNKAIAGLNLTDAQLASLGQVANSQYGKDLIGNKGLIAIAQGDAASNTSSASGTITVGLKPEVAKYLDIATTGDALVNQAAASGAPPSLSSTGSSTGH